MANFLVTRRIHEGDRDYEQGEVVEFDLALPETQVLMSRGYLLPVPADFKGEAPSSPAPDEPAPSGDQDPVPSTEQDPGAEGAETKTEEGDEPDEVTLEELMALTRVELDDQATNLGIEDPDKMANKTEVAEAILAKLAETE